MTQRMVAMKLTEEEATLINSLRNIRKLYGKNWEHQREYISMLVDELTEPTYD